MSTSIEESVRVGALFECGRVRPVWFVWRRRRYAVEAVTLQWQNKQGSEQQTYFGVNTRAGCFELRLNHASLCWHLMQAEE